MTTKSALLMRLSPLAVRASPVITMRRRSGEGRRANSRSLFRRRRFSSSRRAASARRASAAGSGGGGASTLTGGGGGFGSGSGAGRHNDSGSLLAVRDADREGAAPLEQPD